jgi:hypothetical protein
MRSGGIQVSDQFGIEDWWGVGEKRTVIVVVADDELLELAVLAELAPDVLVEGVEVVLQLGGVHAVLGVVGRVLVEVGHEDGLAVGRLDVFSGAAVAVAAGADFLDFATSSG